MAAERFTAPADQHALRRRLRAPERDRASVERPIDATQREAGQTGVAAARRDRLYRAVLAGCDLVAACIALTITLLVVGHGRPQAMLALGVPLILVVSKLKGLYDRDDLVIRKSTLDEVPQLFQLATLYTLALSLLDDTLFSSPLAAGEVLVLWAALFGAAFAVRYFTRIGLEYVLAPERILFIGDAETYERLRAKLDGRRGVALVGRMSMQRVRGGARTAETSELCDMFGYTNTDRVVISPRALPAKETHDLVRSVKQMGVRVSLLPDVFDVVGTSVVMDEIEGMTLLGVPRFGLSRSSSLVKRTFDLAGSLVALLAAAPVMAAIAVAVKLDGGGPVLFRQERVGRDGRRFRICKFRTMCVDAEEQKAELRGANEVEGGLFKIADDPRVTRIGRLLRKTSLDELPQLFNVVSGDMSMVGPRPLVIDEDEQITGFDRSRLALTPGMTGHWQILGSARVPLPEMLKIDYLYVANWSLWKDLQILLRTVPYMLSRKSM